MDAEGRRQACLGHHTAVPLPSLDPLSVVPLAHKCRHQWK